MTTRASCAVALLAIISVLTISFCSENKELTDMDTTSDSAIDASPDGGELTYDELVALCDERYAMVHYEAMYYRLPPELFTLPLISDTPDEQVSSCEDPYYPKESNINILYEDYHGHEGCSMVIGVACAFGWLIFNDDPLDPAALAPHENLCEGCSKEKPCTHVFHSTLALGNKSLDEMGGSTRCTAALMNYWEQGPYEERLYPPPTVVRVFEVQGDSTFMLLYGHESCTCDCEGVLTGCSVKGLEPFKTTPYEPLPVETDPLTLVEPYQYSFADALADIRVNFAIWCSIGACLEHEGMFPTDLQEPPEDPF